MNMSLLTKISLMTLLATTLAMGQTSNVTATIADPDGQTWNNGTFSIVFIPTPGVPGPYTWSVGTPLPIRFSGTMNASGVLTVSLPDNAFIAPLGSKWQFTLCGNTSAPCQNVVTAVTGAAPNLSTALSSPLIAPRFSPGPNAFGYLDAEVIGPPAPGANYWNVTSLVARTWNGSAWTNNSVGTLNTLGPSFNVAVNYSCKPDGVTDNSTCITNAFAASNAVTGGVPTVYFPCVVGVGCQYNINAGAGLSPFNPVIPTAIKCDPEVTLNFTSGSTAHAMDIGPTTTNSIPAAAALANKGYSILYCRLTGGANVTEGIFINQYTPKVEIRGNTFFNFGNASSYSIWCQAECWWLNVQTNYEWNIDGVNHNFLRDNNATGTIDDESYIANNLNVCTNGTAVVNCGVGYSMAGFFTIYSNDLAGHVPAVLVQTHTNGGHIFENVIEVDVPAAGNIAAIQSAAGATNTQVEISGNNFYAGAATDYLVGTSSGSDLITKWNIHDNWLRQDSPGGTQLINLNNLANQTSLMQVYNNVGFTTVSNTASNIGVPPTTQQSPPMLCNTIWCIGSAFSMTGAATSDLWFASQASNVFTGRWKFSGTTNNLEGVGVVGVATGLTSTNSITGPVPVKADTANSNNVVVTTTTDTGAGIVIGICSNSPGAAVGCEVVTEGVQALILGTGTCAIGNFVIVDTTTNGRVKCTGTYTAGTIIGVALAAQNTVGNAFNVMVGLR